MATLRESSAHPAAARPAVCLRALLGHAAELAFFVILSFAFFWRQLFGDGFVPFDFVEQHWMFQSQVAMDFQRVGLTQWTRYIFAGYPSIGDPLFARFYLPNVLMYVFCPPSGLPLSFLHWHLALHYAAAGFFASLLARDLTGQRLAGLVAGVVYGFGGFMASHAQFLAWIDAAAWLPLALWTLRRFLLSRAPAYWVMTAIAMALLALAGHAQTLLYAAYALVGWAVIVPCLSAPRPRLRELGFAALAAIAAVAAAAGLAAVQLLPALKLAAESSRSTLTYAEAAGSALAPTALLTFVLPNVFGYEGAVGYWGPGDIAETYLYAGSATLLLALLAFAVRPGRLTVALGGLFLLTVAFALGDATPLFRAAYDWLPGFDMVRRPNGAMIFAQLCLALLAATTVAAMRHKRPRGRLAVALSLAVALAGLLAALAWLGVATPAWLTPTQAEWAREEAWRSGGRFALAAVAVGLCLLPTSRPAAGRLLLVLFVAVELLWLGAGKGFNLRTDEGYNRTLSPTYLGDVHSSVIPYLHSDPDYRHGGWLRVDQAPGDHLWFNGTEVVALEGTWGYSQLRLRDYEQFYLGVPRNSQAYRLLAAKYVVAKGEMPEFVAPDSGFPLVLQDKYWVYRNEAALPRAFVVFETAQARDRDDALRLLLAADFQPERMAILEEASGLPPAPAGAQATVQWLANEQDRLALRVHTSHTGLLVVSDPYYPGWTAAVDGVPTPILRTNLAFRGILLPPGEHTVTLEFHDEAFFRGVVVTAATGLALLLLLAVAAARPGHRRRSLVAAGILAALFAGTAGPWLAAPTGSDTQATDDLLARVNEATVVAPAPTIDVIGKRYASVLTLKTAGEWRRALLLHSPADLELPVQLTGGEQLRLGIAIYKNLFDYTDGVTFVVRLRQGGTEREVFRRHLAPKTVAGDRRWFDLSVPLGGSPGEATIILTADPGPAADTAGDWALWGPLTLMKGEPVALPR